MNGGEKVLQNGQMSLKLSLDLRGICSALVFWRVGCGL